MPAPTIIDKMATAGLAVCLVALPFNTPAQTGRSQQDPAEVVRVYTELVQTDVSVFDKQGSFVDKLRKEDFELRIDGKCGQLSFSNALQSAVLMKKVNSKRPEAH